MISNNEENKRMIIDGQIVDLDNMPLEDLKKIQERLAEKEKQLKKLIQAEIQN